MRSQPQHSTCPTACQPVVFTATRIAEVLHCSKRSILVRLDGVPPSASLISTRARLWTIEALPQSICSELAEAAQRAGYRSAETLLQAPGIAEKRLDAELSLVKPHCLAKANKLREALASTLRRLDDCSLTEGEQVAMGQADYSRVFGRTISSRQFRKLLKRTLDRAGGSDDFERLDLYLDARVAKTKPISRPCDPALWQVVADQVDRCGNPAAPSQSEQIAIWSTILQAVEAQISEGANADATLAELRSWLWGKRYPWLSPSETGLAKLIRRRWNAHLDGRPLLNRRGREKAAPVDPNDALAIATYAVFNTGSRIEQASKELARLGPESGLARGTLELLTDPRTGEPKRLNRRMSAEVSPIVSCVKPYYLGRKSIDAATASLERDYSKLFVMEQVSGDDLTPPVYFRVPDGRGGWRRTRGQLLIKIDCRSTRILTRRLIPSEQYSALAIAQGQTEVATKLWCPKEWYFECGIWKRSHLVQRTAPPHWEDAMSWTERKSGWEALGVKFTHAIRARSKVVEGVFRMLQDRMERVVGYCGRAPREVDCPDANRKRLLAFDRGEWEMLPSYDEWLAQLDSIIDDYNSTRHDPTARIIPGMSPNEAFDAFQNLDDPPMDLSAFWHLVACYRRRYDLRADRRRKDIDRPSIDFRFTEWFSYYGPELAPYRGRQVWIWFDPTHTSSLGVSLDERGTGMVMVPRAVPVHPRASKLPQGDPEREIYEEQLRRQAGCNGWAKNTWKTVQAVYRGQLRQTFATRSDAAVAKEFAEQREALETAERNRRNTKARAVRTAERIGANPRLVTGDGEQAEWLDRIAAARAKINQEAGQ